MNLDDVEQELVDLMMENAPREICGLLCDWDGKVVVIQVDNTSSTPNVAFAMGGEQLMAAYKENPIAIWHSHPHGPDEPSQMDRKYADPELLYAIVTISGLHVWDSNTWEKIR